MKRSTRGVWRWACFRVGALLIAVAILEAGAWLAFRLSFGQWYSPDLVIEAQQSAAGEERPAQTAVQRRFPLLEMWGQQHMLHPYVGFVRQPRIAIVNRHGFYGPDPVPDFPAEPVAGPRPFRVAVTGGSFAAQAAIESSEVLAESLRRRLGLSDREVEVANLALGGMKQPQQLMSLMYFESLGTSFDLVVNIDGFNELALGVKNAREGITTFFPGLWYYLTSQLPDVEVEKLAGRAGVLLDARRSLARFAQRGRYSAVMGSLWYAADRWLEHRRATLLLEVEDAVRRRAGDAGSDSLPEYVRGPQLGILPDHEAYRQVVEVWQLSSDRMHRYMSVDGHYVHFLQPNQYIPDSKPLSSEELARAVELTHPYAESIIAGYPMLRAAGARLQEKGVDFVDLTMAFADHPETLYADACCHLNVRGYDLVMEIIADEASRRVLAEGPAVNRH